MKASTITSVVVRAFTFGSVGWVFDSRTRNVHFFRPGVSLSAIKGIWPIGSPFATFLYASGLNPFRLSPPGVSLKVCLLILGYILLIFSIPEDSLGLYRRSSTCRLWLVDKKYRWFCICLFESWIEFKRILSNKESIDELQLFIYI